MTNINHLNDKVNEIDFRNSQFADIYLVGGAVRDRLLGLDVIDRDYVVVGSKKEDMLKSGFEQVGSDFPVFLHPVTHEEYALARTERKKGLGYKGFDFATENISLEEDLSRRDLTINSIAEDKNGNIIDPYNGRKDIDDKILRHVGDAFIEDPVRVLRVARFAAKFANAGFEIAPETIKLMQVMVDNGEVSSLVPERVTSEMFKALDTDSPQVFFETLNKVGALDVIFPEVSKLFGIPQRKEYHPEVDTGIHVMMCLSSAAKHNATRLIRFALLCHDLGKGNTPASLLPKHYGHEQRGVKLTKQLCDRLKVPKKYKEMAMKTSEFHTHIHRITEIKEKTILKLFKTFGVYKDLSLFSQFVEACTYDSLGRKGFEYSDYPQAKIALKLAYLFQKFDPKPFIKEGMQGDKIGNVIRVEQIKFIKKLKDEILH